MFYKKYRAVVGGVVLVVGVGLVTLSVVLKVAHLLIGGCALIGASSLLIPKEFHDT